ncbi:MAG: hypothetical protein HKN58_03000 [Xanthomonadales bacterium]|nr:hypothetical protein [Xanthomonadales bacterium]
MNDRLIFAIPRLLPMLLCLGFAASASAQPVPLLFESDDVLQLAMEVDFDTLCRPSEDPDCDFVVTEFTYEDDSGETRTVPVGIQRRDGWRAQQTNCQVPTLFVRFSDEDTAGTPFEGQNLLALTSHCGKGYRPENVPSRRLPDQFESYVINEYLGYRLYNLVTDASLKVRLVKMRYQHPENSRLDFSNDAFFSEHFSSLAERLSANITPPGSFELARLDFATADRMAIFHYMIGNTDWSIQDQENVALLETADGKLLPVAYDFDMSGLVSAHYARPAAGLPVRNVKQRYFMGFCHPYSDWDALFEEFAALRDPSLKLVSDTPGLGRGDRRVSGAYLDSFFRMLESTEARKNNISDACLPIEDQQAP